MRMSVALVFGALLGLATAAAAQDPSPSASCTCMLAGNSVGTVHEVGGQVLVSASRGYAPAGPDTELAIGDRIVLMNEGRAVLDGGAGCRVEVAAPALVSVIALQDGACIAREELDVTVAPAQAPPGAGSQSRHRLTGVARLSDDSFFADLSAFLGTRGVAESVRARNLEEVLPVSP